MKIEFNKSNYSDVIKHVNSSLNEDDVVAVDFGHIGALVINGLSSKANNKVIKLKSKGGRERKGPLSALISVSDILKFDLIDMKKLSRILNVTDKKKIINILERFEGIAFKRLPLSIDKINIFPSYLIEYQEGTPSIQIFTFLGQPGELQNILSKSLKNDKTHPLAELNLLGVTSLNFSGQKSATTEDEIQRVCSDMGIEKYIAVRENSSYRSGSFPIIDFTGNIGSHPYLVRNGNINYHILKLLLPQLKNKDGFIQEFLTKRKLDPTSKEILNLSKEFLKRDQNTTEQKYIRLRNYILEIIQDIVILNG